MTVTTVENETYLEPGGYYVRLNSDPKILQHQAGAYFALSSGLPWPHSGYKREAKRSDGTGGSIMAGSGFGDVNDKAVKAAYAEARL